MTRYAAFLRGINVGKTKRIRTSDIASMLSTSFDNVVSYGQSGNFVFDTDMKKEDIVPLIVSRLRTEFATDVPCIVRTLDELQRTVNNIPFRDACAERLFFVFTGGDVNDGGREWSYGDDAAVRIGDVVYLNCIGKYHETKLSNGFFEKELNAVCTTRNLNTVDAVLRL
jgi:uncharacterized protein (DUF1697 family)